MTAILTFIYCCTTWSPQKNIFTLLVPLHTELKKGNSNFDSAFYLAGVLKERISALSKCSVTCQNFVFFANGYLLHPPMDKVPEGLTLNEIIKRIREGQTSCSGVVWKADWESLMLTLALSYTLEVPNGSDSDRSEAIKRAIMQMTEES